ILGAEADFVRRAAEEWSRRERRADFATLHLAVQRRAIQLQLREQGVYHDFDLVEQLRGSANQPVSVGFGLTVYRDDAGRIVRRATVEPIFKAGQITMELKGRQGVAEFGGLQIHWQ